MLIRLIIFAIINFGGLAIGANFTGDGVISEWYQNMNKAPWTPPGWVFGAAWTTIMICFSIYLAILWDSLKSKTSFYYLFASSLILNVIWNPVFFHMHQTGIALIVITALTILVFTFIARYKTIMKSKTLLLAPYAIWMIIATSLNAYAWLMN